MNEIEAFILIGGRSSRLGTDKALVDFDGRSLARRSIDVVGQSLPSAKITAVAGNETKFAMFATALGIPFIFDLYENRGPLGGLHAALANANSPWIFLLACDYPFVSRELIEFLAGRISAGPGAIVPEQKDGRLQPLCALYNVAKARPVIDAIIDKPRVPPPMRDVAMELDTRIIRFDEYSHLPGSEYLFININTIDDLDKAREIQRKLSAPE